MHVSCMCTNTQSVHVNARGEGGGGGSTSWPRVEYGGGCKWSCHLD